MENRKKSYFDQVNTLSPDDCQQGSRALHQRFLLQSLLNCSRFNRTEAQQVGLGFQIYASYIQECLPDKEVQVLRRIWMSEQKGDVINPTKIAEVMGYPANRATAFTSRLKTRGFYIETTTDPTDQRIHLLTIKDRFLASAWQLNEDQTTWFNRFQNGKLVKELRASKLIPLPEGYPLLDINILNPYDQFMREAIGFRYNNY